MLPEMKYPGDTSLSEEIRGRILTTFEQALELAGSGSHREALLGCDFVLRLDPLFEPARTLHRRLSEGASEVRVADLRALTSREAATGSDEAAAAFDLEAHDETGPVGDPPLSAAPLEPPASEPAPSELQSGAPVDETPAGEAPADLTAGDEGLATVFQPVPEEVLEEVLDDDPAEESGLGDVALDGPANATGVFRMPPPDDVVEPEASTPEPSEPIVDAAVEPEASLATLETQEPENLTPAVSPVEEMSLDETPLEKSPTQRVEPLGVEEPTIQVPDAMLDDASPSEDGELIRTFVDEKVEDGESLGDDLLSSSKSLDDMAPPLGAPTQLDAESQRRIEVLLEEGQNAYDIGEFQSAIDSWSRVFLIDIDHSEANHRIEQARRMAAEAERRIEEVFHEAISHLDGGDTEQAREALNRALELQPGHLAAHELLDRIDSGEAVREPPRVDDAPPTTPAGFDLDETYDREEGGEDLFAAPDIVPAAAELEPPPPPQVPDARKKPRQTFLIVGSVVLGLVIGGGWYLINSWDALFPNSDISQGETAPQRIDPIARAKKLHEQGKTSIAIAQLRRLPPGDPHYAEGQALVAQWETAETEGQPEGPSADEMARFAALVDRAKQAHTQREYLLVDGLLERAAAIAPLPEEVQAIKAEADVALEPLAEQIQVFRAGDWEYALPTLWRLRESDASNPDITRLIIDSYYNLGVRDLQRGNPGSALAKFEEALNLRPDDPTLTRLRSFAATYDKRSEDLLYRIFVKYLPFR